jgi:peptidyl-prolyl cis-trans isomerase C
MQRILRNVALALAAASLAFGAIAQQPKAEKAAPAAKAGQGRVVVNGVTIPQARFEAMNRELNAQGQPESPERQQAIREELVNREILAQAASKRGLDKSADFNAQMDMARQAVLVRALFENEIKANPITDDMLRKQYDEFKSAMGSNEYKVRHILVEKEDEAKAVIAELNKGGDFAKLAKDKSKDPGSKDNGGDLDWGPAGRYVKPFADAVTALPKGQTTTTPVKTDFGYHVIRVEDVRPMKVPAFDEVKEQFRQRAQQQQIQKLVMELRQKAKIEER